jgi:hypothetical protein
VPACDAALGRGGETAESFEGGAMEGLGVVDAPLTSQPFSVVQLQLRPLERTGIAPRVGERYREMCLGAGRFGD